MEKMASDVRGGEGRGGREGLLIMRVSDCQALTYILLWPGLSLAEVTGETDKYVGLTLHLWQ